MVTVETLMTVASIVAGFGVAVVMFRLQRELTISDANWKSRRSSMSREGSQDVDSTRTWLPLADGLVVASILISLLFVILPILLFEKNTDLVWRRAFCAASVALLAGYIPTILGHYNFISGLDKSRPRTTRSEFIFFVVTVLVSMFMFGLIISGFSIA